MLFWLLRTAPALASITALGCDSTATTRPASDDKKAEKEANAKMQEVQKKLQPFYDEYFKIAQPKDPANDTAEAKKEREKKAAEILSKKEFQEVQKEQQKLFETVRKYQRPTNYLGNVWLYQRKAPTAASE